KSLAWQAQLAVGIAALVVIVGIVTMYAPQRSAQEYAERIDLDTRTLTAAQQQKPLQELAITAAKDKLDSDTARLHRAESSDRAQAAGFPLAEALTGAMALEGALLVALSVRRRRALRRLARNRAEQDRTRAEIQGTQDRWAAAVARELHDAGVPGFAD